MTKEEQIEEMAKIIRTAPFLHDGSSEYFLLKRDSAKALYNDDYRKIDDKCVVITKDDLNIYKRKAVKAFAEKLKEKLLNFIEDNEDYDGKVSSEILYIDVIGIIGKNGDIISLGLIDELLKEYEVEE